MTQPPLKTRIGRYNESRFWKVIQDPSNLFTGNLFRLMDLEAGGFDPGTIFEHIHNGARLIAGADGTTRKRDSNGKLSSTRHSKRKTIHQTKAAPDRLRADRNPHRRLPA